MRRVRNGTWIAFALWGVGCREQTPRSAADAAASLAPRSPAPSGTPGSLVGRIRVTGSIPKEPPAPLPPAVTKLCGRNSEARSAVIGQEDGLQDAVVWLDAPALPRGPNQPAATVILDQRRCAYSPRVVTARAGDMLEVRNSDDLLHNVRAGEGTRTWFNLAMPFAGMKTVKSLPERSTSFAVGCDVHPWMKAWVRSFDHPWFAQTGADGQFRIEKVPEGKQTVHLWHERFPERSVQIEVASGQPARLDSGWKAVELR